MSDHVFATALRDYLDLKDELDKFSEIKKRAFFVFNENLNHNQLLLRLTGPWLLLCDWNLDANNSFNFDNAPDFGYISECFVKLISGEFNYKQFYRSLDDVRNNIIAFEIALSTITHKAHHEISLLYDTSTSFDPNLAFIFSEPKVKALFMKLIES